MMNEGKKGFKVRHKRKVASIEPTKPRNYVAKNAINSGAGAHKDKKKAMKQGDTKHKKSYAEGMEEKYLQQLAELKQSTKDSYKEKASAQVKELEPHAKKGEYKDIAQRAIDRRKKGLKRVEEVTGDPKFDKMLKGVTGKKAVAKQRKADSQQQARHAIDSMFGGGNPADKLSIRKKGVAEGAKGAVAGGVAGAFAGPEAIPVGMEIGDKVGDMFENTDTEGGMARQQLITAAKLAIKLAEQMDENTQLDAWVQTKISLASDYIETVFDFLVNGQQDVDKEVETDEEVAPGITHQHRHGTMKSTSTAMEGAKVDRQAKHITKSMMKAHPGMSKEEAEGAAWAHIKHPKKKKMKEDAYQIYLDVLLEKSLKK